MFYFFKFHHDYFTLSVLQDLLIYKLSSQHNHCFTVKTVCSLVLSNLSDVAVLVSVQCVKLIRFSILSRIFPNIPEQVLLNVRVILAFLLILFIQSLQRSKSNGVLVEIAKRGHKLC